jgi:hypothetical protein
MSLVLSITYPRLWLERALTAEEERLVKSVGTDPISSFPPTTFTSNSRELSPREIDPRCWPSVKLIQKSILDFYFSQTTNSTKTRRNDTVTGVKKMDGNGTLDAIPQKAGSKVEEILQERGSRYGAFKDHAYICQSFKLLIEEFLDVYKPNRTLPADQKQALDVICDKVARIINGDENYLDNWDDIAGYATLVSKRLQNDG